MNRKRVGIYLASPIVAEGVSAILSGVGGYEVSRGPWDVSEAPGEDSDGVPELVVTDFFYVRQLPDDVPVIGVVGSAVPQDFLSRFADTITLYDSAAEICRKVKSQMSAESVDNRGNDLSPREKEVILHVVKGLSNKEIADNMNVSVNTIMTHRRNIASKLKIHSPAGLTIFALATGLVRMEEITD